MSKTALFLLPLFVASFVDLQCAHAEDSKNADTLLLDQTIKDSTDAGILSYLKSATWTEFKADQVKRQIDLLASPDYKTREKATAELSRPALNLLPFLRAAQSSAPAEIQRRLATCITKLEHPVSYEKVLVFRAAVRETIRRRPPGMEECLLLAIPMLLDDELAIDVQLALADAVQRRKSVDPLFEDYLNDSIPIRRSIAGLLLARFGTSDQKLKSKKLLTDESPVVRLRTAQGLLAAGDKTVVPILVSLLSGKPVFVAWQAEELLVFIAGKDAALPIPAVGDGRSASKAHQGWQKWWAQHGEKVNLPAALMVGHAPAFFLIQSFEPDETFAFVVGGDGKLRWHTRTWKDQSDQGAMCKVDQILDDDRLLIWSDRTANQFRVNPQAPAELSLRERDLNGETRSVIISCLHGDFSGTIPRFYARRIMAGHTICVNAEGRDDLQTPAERIIEGRTRNSNTNVDGPLFRLTERQPSNRSISFERFPIRPRALLLNSGNSVEIEGGEKFEGTSIHRERDTTGRLIWEVKGEYQYVARLRDGHYLATGYRGHGIFELDEHAQVIWKVPARANVGEIRLAAPLLRLGFSCGEGVR
jgi:hypothetical protein